MSSAKIVNIDYVKFQMNFTSPPTTPLLLP